ncbi:unnamed protein product [Linum trigynum]|uniref:PROP1-like PPR domain-containing protein n=1 Tax=Linum trigynum TaxID=586398 RepID=A0AAV2FJE1_9ROSI
MGSLRRLLPSMLSSAIRNPTSRSLPSPLPSLRPAFLHSVQQNQNVVESICNSVRASCNWDSLTKKFGSVGLTDSLVRGILLELREPPEAKRALGFFHWSAQRVINTVHGVHSYCIMVHILVGARLVTDARALLESVLKRSRAADHDSRFEVVDSLLDSYRVTVSNPLVFNLLVQGYAKLRMLEIGFEVCCYLEDRGFSLTLISYNTLLHFVLKSHEIELLWKVYERMISRRIYPDEAGIRAMIHGLCKEGKLQEMIGMLDKIHGKRSAACSPLVIVSTGLVLRILEEEEGGRIEVAMGLLRLMLQKNMITDTVAFSLIVHAKVKLGDLSSANEVYEEMLKRGFDANSFCYTSFVEGYCHSGRVEDANNLLREMKSTGLKPYSQTFDHIILGCAKTGRVEESLEYCSEMMSMGHLPTLSVFNEMLAKVMEQPVHTNQANEILTSMMDKGFFPNEITYSRLMAAYAKDGKVEEVAKLYYEMEYRAISPGELGFASIISSLCDCGKVEEAGRVLKVMKDRGVRPVKDVYEALIHGHLDKGNEEIAARLRREMVLYD